jgi:hypothetical protein
LLEVVSRYFEERVFDLLSSSIEADKRKIMTDEDDGVLKIIGWVFFGNFVVGRGFLRYVVLNSIATVCVLYEKEVVRLGVSGDHHCWGEHLAVGYQAWNEVDESRQRCVHLLFVFHSYVTSHEPDPD